MRIDIRTKLAVSFGGILGIVLLAGALAIWQLHVTSDALGQLADTQLAGARQTLLDLRDGNTRFGILSTGGMFLGLLCGVTVGLYVSEGLSRSARQLAAAADGIARGNLDQQITVKSHDEMGDLAIAFALMIQTNRNLLAEMGKLVQAAQAGELSRRGEAAGFSGACALAGAFPCAGSGR